MCSIELSRGKSLIFLSRDGRKKAIKTCYSVTSLQGKEEDRAREECDIPRRKRNPVLKEIILGPNSYFFIHFYIG